MILLILLFFLFHSLSFFVSPLMILISTKGSEQLVALMTRSEVGEIALLWMNNSTFLVLLISCNKTISLSFEKSYPPCTPPPLPYPLAHLSSGCTRISDSCTRIWWERSFWWVSYRYWHLKHLRGTMLSTITRTIKLMFISKNLPRDHQIAF